MANAQIKNALAWPAKNEYTKFNIFTLYLLEYIRFRICPVPQSLYRIIPVRGCRIRPNRHMIYTSRSGFLGSGYISLRLGGGGWVIDNVSLMVYVYIKKHDKLTVEIKSFAAVADMVVLVRHVMKMADVLFVDVFRIFCAMTYAGMKQIYKLCKFSVLSGFDVGVA